MLRNANLPVGKLQSGLSHATPVGQKRSIVNVVSRAAHAWLGLSSAFKPVLDPRSNSASGSALLPRPGSAPAFQRALFVAFIDLGAAALFRIH